MVEPATYLDRYVSEAIATLEAPYLGTGVQRFLEVLIDARAARGLVFFFGNGASASTASHFVCDIGKAVNQGAGRRIRCLALNDSVTTTTAWANDTEFEDVFSEQLRTLAPPGDVAVALSPSGVSPNIRRALRLSRELGLRTVGLGGDDGVQLGELCDVAILVPSSSPEHIEDVHLLINHVLTAFLRDEVPIPGR